VGQAVLPASRLSTARARASSGVITFLIRSDIDIWNETKEHSDGGRCHYWMAQFDPVAGRAVIDGNI
jgi:hypothetical protein